MPSSLTFGIEGGNRGKMYICLLPMMFYNIHDVRPLIIKTGTCISSEVVY